jgi:hypothetical protein
MAIFEVLIEEAVEMLFFTKLKSLFLLKETLEVAQRGGNLRRKVADSKQVGGVAADNARQGKAALVHHRLVRWKWNRFRQGHRAERGSSVTVAANDSEEDTVSWQHR